MNRSTLIGSMLLLTAALTACTSSNTKQAASTRPSNQTPATSTATASSGAAPGSSSSAPSSQPTITIKNFAFAVPAHVSPGEKITVHNEDSETHSVTADTGGSFDVNVPASSTATLTAPTKPGKYPFHCNFHSSMQATLTVA